MKFAGRGKNPGERRGLGCKKKIERVLRDLLAQFQAVLQGGREMNASVKPRLADFLRACPQALITAGFSRKTVRRNREANFVAAVEVREDDRSRPAERAVSRDILGECGRVEERYPVRVRLGAGIPVTLR